MLDQNTDRMWYVIGAVIIGAAIILILNNTFPQLFASVGNTFKDKTEQTTEVVDGILPKTREVTPIYNKDVEVSSFPVGTSLIEYDTDTETWDLSVPYNDFGWSGGLSIRKGVIEVPYGATYTLSYDVWSPLATYAQNDINNQPLTGVSWSINAHDNDNYPERLNAINKITNEKQEPMVQNLIPANTWTTLSFTYYNTSPENINKTTISDYSAFGATSPTKDPLSIKIRNVNIMVKLAD